jgi:hypothetical protein
VESLRALLAEGWDAVFVGSGAPRGREIDIPGRQEAAANIHIGIDWLSSVSFGHTTKIGKRVVVLGGGNTAMDCCRSAKRLGGEDVHVVVRSGFDEMKASPWEKEDAAHEGIPIHNFLVPKVFTLEAGKLSGVLFEKVAAQRDAKGRRQLMPTGEPDVHFPCDDVLVAIGQENGFPWIERDIGIEFDAWGMPVVDKSTMAATRPGVFFGGDAAFGPKNIIWAVAHGHDAAISIDKYCRGEDMAKRPPPHTNLISQKMGIHEWSYDNAITPHMRHKVPLKDKVIALADIASSRARVRSQKLAYAERSAASTATCRPCSTKSCVHRVRRLRRYLPDGLHLVHRGRRRGGAESAPAGARDEPDARPLRVGAAQDRPHHGEGRGRVPALRPVRGALPDRSVGHAEVPAGDGACRRGPEAGARARPRAAGGGLRAGMKPIASVNDFVVKFANVNGSGSASANGLFAKAVLKMGVPVAARNIFPSNIQGLPTWYEVRVVEAGWRGRRGGVDLMVAMNPGAWDEDVPRSNRAAIFYDSISHAAVGVPRRHRSSRCR